MNPWMLALAGGSAFLLCAVGAGLAIAGGAIATGMAQAAIGAAAMALSSVSVVANALRLRRVAL